MKVLLAFLSIPLLAALVACSLTLPLTEKDIAIYEHHALDTLSAYIVQDWLKTKPTEIDEVCSNVAFKSRRDCILAIRAYVGTELAKSPKGRAAIHQLATAYLKLDGWQRDEEREMPRSSTLIGQFSQQGYEASLSRPFGLRYGYLGSVTSNAYGPGVHSDGTGRPFMWAPDFGGPALGPITPNAYGPGIGMDGTGRPVRPSCLPGMMC